MLRVQYQIVIAGVSDKGVSLISLPRRDAAHTEFAAFL